MTIKPEVLDALVAAGATAEMLVAAIKADAAKDEAKKAESRVKAAERQRRHRLSRVTNANIDVTERDTPLDGPPSPHTPQPPLNPPASTPLRSVSAAPRRASAIPNDWKPTPAGVEFAVGKGMSRADIADEVQRFRDHHLGKGSLMKDWDAAWRTWCQSPYRKSQPPRGSPQRQSSSWLEAGAQEIREMRGQSDDHECSADHPINGSRGHAAGNRRHHAPRSQWDDGDRHQVIDHGPVGTH